MKYFIGIGLIFGLGSCVGTASVTPEVDFVEIAGPTRTIVEEAPEAVKVEVLPDSCARALVLAEIIANSGNKIYDINTAQLTIISRGREAIGGADTYALSTLENQQRALQGATLGDFQKLARADYEYQLIDQDCEAAIE